MKRRRIDSVVLGGALALTGVMQRRVEDLERREVDRRRAAEPPPAPPTPPAPSAPPSAGIPGMPLADRLRPAGARTAGRVDRPARVPAAGLRARLDDALPRVPAARRGSGPGRPAPAPIAGRSSVLRGAACTTHHHRTPRGTRRGTRTTCRTARTTCSARCPGEPRTLGWRPAARLRRRSALLIESRDLRGHVVLRAGKGIAGGPGVGAPLARGLVGRRRLRRQATRRSVFPKTARASIAACASATRASGNVWPITGEMRPAASSPSTAAREPHPICGGELGVADADHLDRTLLGERAGRSRRSCPRACRGRRTCRRGRSPRTRRLRRPRRCCRAPRPHHRRRGRRAPRRPSPARPSRSPGTRPSSRRRRSLSGPARGRDDVRAARAASWIRLMPRPPLAPTTSTRDPAATPVVSSRASAVTPSCMTAAAASRSMRVGHADHRVGSDDGALGVRAASARVREHALPEPALVDSGPDGADPCPRRRSRGCRAARARSGRARARAGSWSRPRGRSRARRRSRSRPQRGRGRGRPRSRSRPARRTP